MSTEIKVLIVDDNQEFCQLLAEFLEMNEDFKVVEILHNGEEALNYLINNQNPDILIIDLIMPHLDGIGVLEELNSRNLINTMKIVALTAMGHDEIMKTVINLGVHYYIMKPFDLDKLVTRLRQLVIKQEEYQPKIRYSAPAKEEKDYPALITSIMHEMGIPAHIKGYHYIRYAVESVINDIDLINAVTKELYPKVAAEFNTTPSRVERAIRHAIEVVWQRGSEEALKKYFANNINENMKPTNSQFIARIADKIRIDLKVS